MERRAGKTVSVSWSPAQGQYRKYVGYQLGRSGKPQPKCWYLGGDEREAVRRAVELVAEWNRLKAAGATVWPLKAASGEASENKKAKDDFVDANALTVREVCSLYLDSYRRLAEAKQVSWGFVHSTEHRLGWVKRALGEHVRLASIGEREIQEAVLLLVRRPLARRRNHQTKEPRPLAISMQYSTLPHAYRSELRSMAPLGGMNSTVPRAVTSVRSSVISPISPSFQMPPTRRMFDGLMSR